MPLTPLAWRIRIPPKPAGDDPDRRARETWISRIRILALLTLAPAAWIGIIPAARPEVAGTIGVLGSYVILVTLGPGPFRFLQRADLVVVLDILAVTIVVLISGTLGSPFLYLYYLAIVEAAVQLDLREALSTAVATSGTMVLLWVHGGHAQALQTPGFRLGVLISGGFFLALLFGTHLQESRNATALALAYECAIDGWARALDLRDNETVGHSRRVMETTLRLARALRVPQNDLPYMRAGALLHDIGKMAVPDRILQKPGPLTPEEWDIMLRHPTYAYEFLTPVPYLRTTADIPYCHHEKWDGSGYPRGLRGEQIPLAARIFAVADVWDALRSDRPYRDAWTDEATRAYIRDQAGTHFDPRVVEVFLTMHWQAERTSARTGGEAIAIPVDQATAQESSSS